MGRIIGRIQVEHLEELKKEISGETLVTLDLNEVTLVHVDIVRFLKDCEEDGIELRNRSAYIREWITRERDTE